MDDDRPQPWKPQNRFLRALFTVMGPPETGPYGPPVPPPTPRPRDAKGRVIKEPKTR